MSVGSGKLVARGVHVVVGELLTLHIDAADPSLADGQDESRRRCAFPAENIAPRGPVSDAESVFDPP
jgi:hypothetical protein